MAIDKAVDSAALESDLTSVANAIRAKTGGSDSLAFPAGMVEAIAGIASGGGGGLKYASGSWTPASDTQWMVVELDFIPSAMAFGVDDWENKALDGISKVLNGAYFNGNAFTQRTNTGGTSAGQGMFTTVPDTIIMENDTTMHSPYILRPRASGGFNIYFSYYFRAGYTYNWEAMGE